MNELDLLKQEATELGVEFAQNIGEKKLQDKIDAAYKAKETNVVPVEPVVEEVEDEAPVVNAKLSAKQKMAAKIKAAKAAAMKTSVVTIMDNDKRENAYTTACTANCSNDYFDLGTRTRIPLNEPIELEQGFINSLRSVNISFHVKDPKTGLNRTKTIKRYSIVKSA